jgi:hypothetical protein
MKADLYQFDGKQVIAGSEVGFKDQSGKKGLLLAFLDKKYLEAVNTYSCLRESFPDAEILMCSTAGEIMGTNVTDESSVLIHLLFERTPFKTAVAKSADYPGHFEIGRSLMKQLSGNDLQYVLVISDGSTVNGSDLVNGIKSFSDQQVLVTGGLAGDGGRFQNTLVGLNGDPEQGLFAAIGLYGDRIQVSHGCQGGWENFGPERIVTKSNKNVLYEIEDKNALELYKKYLGSESANLPGSALLFPLSVTIEGINKPLVRTILSIDEQAGSMTFAGDVPEGSKVRFMKANLDKLSVAASDSANKALHTHSHKPDFTLIISCVGRKTILGPRIEEEVEAVKEIMGTNAVIAGFYSYGEIAPLETEVECQLHNQSITVTSFYES